jgi:hypothetical protein
MTSPRRWSLAFVLVAIVACFVLAGCPETKNQPRPRRPTKVHKKRPVVKKASHPGHEHNHSHPHDEFEHHHHPHPHPHLAGPGGHHHPY